MRQQQQPRLTALTNSTNANAAGGTKAKTPARSNAKSPARPKAPAAAAVAVQPQLPVPAVRMQHPTAAAV